MASIWNSRTMWTVVAYVVALRVANELATRFVWNKVSSELLAQLWTFLQGHRDFATAMISDFQTVFPQDTVDLATDIWDNRYNQTWLDKYGVTYNLTQYGVSYNATQPLLDTIRSQYSAGVSSRATSWWSKLARSALLSMATLPLNYQWQRWLENRYPKRRKPSQLITGSGLDDQSASTHKDVKAVDMPEMPKQSVKGRLILTNWPKKWIINLIVLKLGAALLDDVIKHPTSPVTILKLWISPMSMFVRGIFLVVPGFFEISTYAAFISFIAVPVEHRLPFIEASRLAFVIFGGATLAVVINFLISHPFADALLRNATIAAAEAWNGCNVTSGALAPEVRDFVRNWTDIIKGALYLDNETVTMVLDAAWDASNNMTDNGTVFFDVMLAGFRNMTNTTTKVPAVVTNVSAVLLQGDEL